MTSEVSLVYSHLPSDELDLMSPPSQSDDFIHTRDLKFSASLSPRPVDCGRICRFQFFVSSVLMVPATVTGWWWWGVLIQVLDRKEAQIGGDGAGDLQRGHCCDRLQGRIDAWNDDHLRRQRDTTRMVQLGSSSRRGNTRNRRLHRWTGE